MKMLGKKNLKAFNNIKFKLYRLLKWAYKRWDYKRKFGIPIEQGILEYGRHVILNVVEQEK